MKKKCEQNARIISEVTEKDRFGESAQIVCYRNPGGGGGTLKKMDRVDRGVRPASQNPYPIYDQNLRFSLPYL